MKDGGINISKAILAVYSKVGYVLKGGENKMQNYKYAGEADFIEALRPAMIEAGLISYPVGIRGDCKNILGDKPKNHASYIYTFRIVHADSGEYIEVEAAGEGVGNDDKSSYKAATGAQKYALRQAFLIETGDDPDKDLVSVREEEEKKRKHAEVLAAKEKVVRDNLIPVPEESDETGERDWADYTSKAIAAIKKCTTMAQLNAIRVANKEGFDFLGFSDVGLRKQISEISQQKYASFKAPEQPPVNQGK